MLLRELKLFQVSVAVVFHNGLKVNHETGSKVFNRICKQVWKPQPLAQKQPGAAARHSLPTKSETSSFLTASRASEHRRARNIQKQSQIFPPLFQWLIILRAIVHFAGALSTLRYAGGYESLVRRGSSSSRVRAARPFLTRKRFTQQDDFFCSFKQRNQNQGSEIRLS